MAKTTNFELPIPDDDEAAEEKGYEAILAVRNALIAIDDLLASFATSLAGKVGSDASWEISAIEGLAGALAEKMSSSATFALDDLSNLEGVADAVAGYVLAKQSNGKWGPASAQSVIGSHQHTIESIQDLSAALAALLPKAGGKMAGDLDLGGHKIIDADFSESGIDLWSLQPIGKPFGIWDHMSGCPIPPKGDFIKLTAGLTGSGGYNEGALTSESVSGSFPLVTATAVISAADSPINGGTVHLMNTEEDFLRARSSGVLQMDALQGFHMSNPEGRNISSTDGANGAIATGPGINPLGSLSTSIIKMRSIISDGTNGTPRVANENRGKNIGATFYMRIK